MGRPRETVFNKRMVWEVGQGYRRKEAAVAHSVLPTDDDGSDFAGVDDRTYRQPHPGFGQQQGPRQGLPGHGHDQVGTRRRHG
jgi:hypothetical protein